jgi:WD40 repeat protein
VKSSVVKIPAHANNGNSNPTNSRNYSAAVACLSSIGDNYFVSGGSDNSLVLCDIRMSSSSGEINGEGSGAADSQCIVDQYQHCRNGIYSLCVIGNNCVAVGDGVGMVLVYDVTKSGNEALKYGLSASSNGGVRGITCLDGKIVTAAEDGKVLIYSY